MSEKSALDFLRNTQVIKSRGNIKLKSGIMKLMTSRYLVLCDNSELGPACLVIYESLKHAERSKIKSLYELSKLESVARSLTDNCGVTIIVNDKTILDLICTSKDEANQWVKDITFLKQLRSNRVGCSSCSADDERLFEYYNFMVMMSPCNVTNGQKMKCELMLTKKGISIKELQSKKILAQWPFEVIKSYRLEENKTTIAVDVGSLSTTGSGMFRFSTNQADEIQKFMDMIIIQAKHERTRKISQEKHIYHYGYDESHANYDTLGNCKNQLNDPYEELPNQTDNLYLTPMHFDDGR